MRATVLRQATRILLLSHRAVLEFGTEGIHYSSMSFFKGTNTLERTGHGVSAKPLFIYDSSHDVELVAIRRFK